MYGSSSCTCSCIHWHVAANSVVDPHKEVVTLLKIGCLPTPRVSFCFNSYDNYGLLLYQLSQDCLTAGDAPRANTATFFMCLGTLEVPSPGQITICPHHQGEDRQAPGVIGIIMWLVSWKESSK